MDRKDVIGHYDNMDQTDHRVRVGAERRERMRSRLMESALVVFGSTNVDAGTIDDVIRQARVSRGTFYNYFTNADDLIRAVADQAGTELMMAVAPIVEDHDDPAERMSAGVRSWISLIEQFPMLANFFRRAGLYVLQNDQVRTDMPRDLIAGMEAGRFTVEELELGFVLVAGTVLAAINTMAIGNAPKTYASKLAERVLLSLGVEGADAKAISKLRLSAPKLPPESLIARTALAALG